MNEIIFDPRRVHDRGFVKIYRPFDVHDADLQPLAAELQAERIRPHDDVYRVELPDGTGLAITQRHLAYHHLAQGRLIGRPPFLLTFCPVCNSGMLASPRVEGRVLDFRVAGVYRGTMVMADRQTGTYWDHMTGEALGGPLRGRTLERLGSHHVLLAARAVEYSADLPVAIPRLSWWQRLVTRFQNGHTWRRRPEGKFYPGFAASFVFDDPRRPQKELGLGLWSGAQARFYPLSMVRSGSVTDVLDGREVMVSMDPDTQIPRAVWSSPECSGADDRAGLPADGSMPPGPAQVFTRWYGFAQTFPGCEIWG